MGGERESWFNWIGLDYDFWVRERETVFKKKNLWAIWDLLRERVGLQGQIQSLHTSC